MSRMLAALDKFGFPTNEVTADYLLDRQKILQLGRVPVQVHLMTRVTGLTWDEAWASRQAGSYGDVPVFFMGRGALLVNKRAAGRLKDLADVEALSRGDQKAASRDDTAITSRPGRHPRRRSCPPAPSLGARTSPGNDSAIGVSVWDFRSSTPQR
jgi:hypothetical protein